MFRHLSIRWLLCWWVSVLALATPLTAQIPVNLGNFIWDDRDGDGAQDVGEPGLEGIQIQAWNSAKNQLLDSATTNANGIYTLQVLGAGNYRLRVILPTATSQFSPKNAAGGDDTDDSDFNPSGPDMGFTDVIAIASNVIAINNLDCGLLLDMLPGHTIGNRVFRALANGTQPAANATLGFSATIELLSSTGTVLQTTSTQQLGLNRGYYGFNAPPGTYRLRFTGAAGYIPTRNANAGADDTLDSDVDADGLTALFTLSDGQIRSDMDAGFVLPINVGNRVWHDANNNGLQDEGEPGIAGVHLEIWSADGTRRFDAAITNLTGGYALKAPGPGDYRVWVLRPLATDLFSPKSQGGDATDDSDIITSGDNFGFTDVLSFASNLISITTIDAGIRFAPGPRIIPRLEITGYNHLGSSLTFTGPAGGTYQIERSTHLESWTPFDLPFVTAGTPTTRPISPADNLIPRQYWRVRRTR